jgi:hypothetical protein
MSTEHSTSGHQASSQGRYTSSSNALFSILNTSYYHQMANRKSDLTTSSSSIYAVGGPPTYTRMH